MNGLVLTIRLRTIVLAALVGGAVVLTAAALDATRGVVAELALATAAACLVRPGVLWLARHTPMGVALAAVFIGLVIGVATLLGCEAKAVSTGAEELQHAVPDRLERFQDSLAPGNPLRTFLVEDGIVARVRHTIQGTPSRFILGTESPAEGASRLGQILLVASLGAFMVTQLPKTALGLVDRLPASSREAAAAALRAGYGRGGAYARRTLVLGAGCAVAGGLVAGACGVPGAAVLGLWLGMWAVIPKLGIVVGGLPLVALAGGQGRAQVIAASVGLAAIVVTGEWGRRRWIEGRTVTVGALLSLVALMAGMELGRWPGALVGLVAVPVLLAGIDASDALTPRRGEEGPLASVRSRPTTVSRVGDGDDPSRRVTVEIDPRSLLLAGVVVLALVVAVALIRAVPQSLSRCTVGVLVALALNPLVGVVQRRLRFNRKVAVALVVAVFFGGVGAFALFAVPRAVEQGRQLPQQVPRLVSQLDRAPIVGKAVRERHLDARVRNFLDDLPHLLTTRDKAIEGAARSAGESMLAVSWMFLVLVGALLDGPGIAERLKGALSPSHRPRAERLGDLIYQAVGRTAAGSAFTALLQGAVVLVIGVAFGVPLSPVLAASAAFCAFVPQIGGLLAALPLVVFGLTRSLGTGVAVGLVFLAWMLFNNHVLHAVIVGRAVHISALSSLVAVLVGAALGGFVGAMVATPVVAVGHVLLTSHTSMAEAAPQPSAVSSMEPKGVLG